MQPADLLELPKRQIDSLEPPKRKIDSLEPPKGDKETKKRRAYSTDNRRKLAKTSAMNLALEKNFAGCSAFPAVRCHGCSMAIPVCNPTQIRGHVEGRKDSKSPPKCKSCPFTCMMCGCRFASNEEYKKHMRDESGSMCSQAYVVCSCGFKVKAKKQDRTGQGDRFTAHMMECDGHLKLWFPQ